MSPSTTVYHGGKEIADPTPLPGRATRRSGRPPRDPEQPHGEVGESERSGTELTEPAEQTISRLLIRVRDLPLPSRARVCAEKLGLVRVGDLVQTSPGTFLIQPNFGQRSLQALNSSLAMLGLRLGLRVDGWPPANLRVLARQRRESVSNALQRMFIPRSDGTLEDELRQLTAPAGSPRNMFIAARCLGWDGEGGVTLEKAGREHRISKQRASQIVKRVRRQYRHPRIAPPHLVRCLRAATPRLAEEADAIEDRLHRVGETRTPLR
jgi:hypothetical protein